MPEQQAFPQAGPFPVIAAAFSGAPMRNAIIIALLALTCAAPVHARECLPTTAGAEQVVIRFRDGRRLKGVIACVDVDKVTITSGHTTSTVQRSTIETIVTTRDSVWNGFAVGSAIGLGIVVLGSYEAHLREGDTGRSAAALILGLGGLGALIDAAQHAGGRRVALPNRGAHVVAWRIRF